MNNIETGFKPTPQNTGNHSVNPFTSFNWGLAFRVLSRLVGLSGIAYLSCILKIYVDVAGLGALGSIGQYTIALFFFYMLMITGEKYQTWNFLFLTGLYGVVLTF